MGVTLQLRPEVEAELINQAKARGLTPDQYVEELIRRHSTPGAPSAGQVSQDDEQLVDRLTRIAHKWHRLPTLDARTTDEIIGYDESGLPAR